MGLFGDSSATPPTRLHMPQLVTIGRRRVQWPVGGGPPAEANKARAAVFSGES